MIAVDILLDGLFAAVAAIGFGAISDPPMRAFPRIALLAAVGHALRYCLMNYAGVDIASSSLCAAMVIGFGSLWLGRGVRCPMTVLYIPALLPMVPGIYAYKTVFSLIMFLQSLNDPGQGMQYMQLFFLNATVSLSVIAFWIGVSIQKKTGLVVCNPLLIGVVLTIGVLLLFRIPYEAYDQGAEFISLFLSPATACLAVAIYGKLPLLRRNWLPILVGCTVGSVVSMGSVLLLCRLFGLDEAMTASLLPKSVTTPIAISVSEAHGGIGSITVVAVVLTGIFGSITAPLLIKLFRVREPLAAGLAIGACSHAVGTSRALELGETEGAMSGLAIGVCGIVTVLLSLLLM